jgi:hypothetical protein
VLTRCHVNQLRVCDGCYNLVDRQRQAKQVEDMLKPKKASRSVSDTQEQIAAQREQLFEGSTPKSQTHSDDVRSTTASTMATMAEARDELVERGEKLTRLDDKSAKLADASREFSNMAKQLRMQQEKQNNMSSWWS